MFCPRCGAENEEGSKYCASCGSELARKEKAGGADPGNGEATLGQRAGALFGRDRRTRLVTLGTATAVVVAIVAFIALGASDDEGADVPQDPFTRSLDVGCVQHKGEIAAAQRAALGGGGLPAVADYAGKIVPIAGDWRLELDREAVPADRADLVAALQAALLEVQIEAGALARVAREASSHQVAKAAARVDAATANVETAVASLGLTRCADLVVAQGRLVRQ